MWCLIDFYSSSSSAASELMTPLLEGAPLRAVGGDAALRRRNSDPAPGEPRPADPRSTDYIGQTTNGLFRIAGHRSDLC